MGNLSHMDEHLLRFVDDLILIKSVFQSNSVLISSQSHFSIFWFSIWEISNDIQNDQTR